MKKIFTLFAVVASLFATSCEEEGDSAVGGKIYPTSIEISSLSASKLKMVSGETLELSVDILPEDATEKNYTWKSSDEQKATVSASGVVTAGDTAGEVTITATTTSAKGEELTSDVVLTISLPTIMPESIEISGESAVAIGETITLSAEVKPANASNKGVTWSVAADDTAIASVTADGVVEGVEAGVATIIATADGDNGVKAEYEVTVADDVIKPTQVAITDPAEAKIAKGKTLQLSAEVDADATDKGITWKVATDDADIADVDATGKVTGKAKGTATIVATAKGDNTVTDEIEIEVYLLPTSINISGATSVVKGETITLSATVLPADAENKEVTWSVTKGDGTIATISEAGVVTGVADGDATIIATAKGDTNITKEYEVTVVGAPVYATSVTIKEPTETYYVGDNFTLAATINPTNSTVSVIWESSATSVATIDSSTGAVEVLTAGEVTFTAKAAKDGSDSPEYATDTYTVTYGEKPYVASLAIKDGGADVTSLDIENGSSKNVTCEFTFSGEEFSVTDLKYTISNEDAVSVSVSDGTYTITGTQVTTEAATIKFYTMEGKDGAEVSKTISVNVTAKKVYPTSISYGDNSTKSILYSKAEGLYTTPTPTFTNSGGEEVTEKSITWSITADYNSYLSSTGVLTLDAVMKPAAGSSKDVVVTATAKDKDNGDLTATYTYKFYADPAAESVTITDPDTSDLEVAATRTFAATVAANSEHPFASEVSQDVTWTATAGSFEGAVYTAPADATESVTITATATGTEIKTTTTLKVVAKSVDPTPDPATAPAVGDFYNSDKTYSKTKGDSAIGIVYSVNSDAKTAKVAHLGGMVLQPWAKERTNYANYKLTGMFDDGRKNMDVMLAAYDDKEISAINFPAMGYAHSLNTGVCSYDGAKNVWYMPADSEIIELCLWLGRNKINDLNAIFDGVDFVAFNKTGANLVKLAMWSSYDNSATDNSKTKASTFYPSNETTFDFERSKTTYNANGYKHCILPIMEISFAE